MSMPWYGELPERWETRNIKRLFHIKKDIAGKEGYPVLSVTQKGLKVKNIESNQGQMAQNYAKYQFVNIGDFAMNHMDLLTGWVDVAKVFGVTSPDYRVFVLDDKTQNKDYLLKLLQLCYSQRIFYALGHGAANEGRWRLPRHEFLNFPLPIPPRDEQDQIVRFLDWKTAEINKLINAKRKQIELLQEQKQTVINKAIISKKGVYVRFKNLFKLTKGLNITKENLSDSGIPCISYGQIHSEYGFEVNPNEDELPFVDEDYLKSSPKSLMNYGDFVFADTSEDLSGSGNFAYLNSQTPVFAGYHTIIARMRFKSNYRYIAYYFDSTQYRSQIQQHVNGVKVYSVTQAILNRTNIMLPPIEEQERIVEYLDRQCACIAQSIENISKEINLLNEYHTTLVSDVLTGKIDVQGLVVPKYETIDSKDGNDDESLNKDAMEV
jgi:type I restriction enzyme S subunit